jgi:hypothetical protein
LACPGDVPVLVNEVITREFIFQIRPGAWLFKKDTADDYRNDVRSHQAGLMRDIPRDQNSAWTLWCMTLNSLPRANIRRSEREPEADDTPGTENQPSINFSGDTLIQMDSGDVMLLRGVVFNDAGAVLS